MKPIPSFPPFRALNISLLTADQRKKLKHFCGLEVFGLFLSQETSDAFPVKFWYRGSDGQLASNEVSVHGFARGGTEAVLVLPAEPVVVSGDVYLDVNYIDKSGIQAKVQITGWENVFVGDGLTGSPRKFKLVPVE